MTPSDVAKALERTRIIAILRFGEAASVLPVARALALGGIRALEITLTTPRALELLQELRAELPEDVVLGAGTVLDVHTLARVRAAGAMFVVSPICKHELIRAAHDEGMAALPGCFTPTEIAGAWEAGADLIKVFPASSLGPGFVRDLLGPFPELKLVPTGGIGPEEVKRWFAAGAAAVGLGGGLVKPTSPGEGGLLDLTERARTLLAGV